MTSGTTAGAGARGVPVPALVGLLCLALVLLTGCGRSTSQVTVTGVPTASAAPVVVEVDMLDRRFSPDSFTFSQGSVVVFRFRNTTAERHQAAVGDGNFQQDRVSGQLDPNDPLVNTVVVEPGGTADLPYRMDVPGELLIGCHEPGHWEAGMRATVTVTPAG